VRNTLLIFIYSILFFTSGSLQAHLSISDIQFENFSVKDGLSQNAITDIVEDKQGFIWVATFNGLNRFDGYEFVQYQHDPQDPNSLPAPLARQLFVDSRDNLWVATANGLAKYNPLQDNFDNYTAENSPLETGEIWSISESANGKLLISDSSNFYQMGLRSNQIEKLQLKDQVFPPEIKFTLGQRDRTWIGSYGHGIYLLDNNNQQLHSLAEANPWGIEISARFLFDIKIINQQLWLATEQGVWVLDENDKLLHHYHTDAQQAIVDNVVRSITQGADGHIWLGTAAGISIIDTSMNTLLNITPKNAVLVSLQNELILKTYMDSKGSLWLGTYTGGLHKYNKQNSLVKHYRSIPNSNISLSDNMVWAFAENQQGSYWIATQSGGLNLFNPQTASFEYFLQHDSLTIWDLKQDKNGLLWLATSDGIYIYQYENQKLSLKQHLLKDLVVDKLIAGNDRYWINLETQVQQINIESLTPQATESIAGYKLIAEDSSGRLWLSDNQGLHTLSPEMYSSVELLLTAEHARVYSITESQHFFWLASLDKGLFSLDKTDLSQLKKLKLEEQDTAIYTLLKSEQFLWVVANGNLFKIEDHSQQVVEVLHRNLFNFNDFNEGAGLISNSEQLLLGGTKGFNIFNPQSAIVQSNTMPKAPVITGLTRVNHQEILGDSQLLSQPMHLTKELALEDRDFPISLKFSLLNPKNKDNIEYRYKLLGLSDNWLSADNVIRQATFSNLSFGEYQFVLQAREMGQHWSSPRELFIKVKAPVWLQPQAILAYSIILMLFLYYLHKQYKSRQKVQQQIKDNEERLKLTLWGSGDELWDWDIPNEEIIRVNQWQDVDFPRDAQRNPFKLNKSNIHESDLSRVQAAIHRHLEHQSNYYEVAYRLQTLEGKWIWVLDRGKVVEFNEHRLPVRMTGTLKNISHLKQAEEQLKLFQRSIETISDGVFITDQHFRLISVNPAYCKITGEANDLAIGSYLTFKRYPDSFEHELKNTLKQTGNWSGEVESVRQNEQDYMVDMLIDAIYGEDRKISHYVGVFSDITSRKSTEKELVKLANSDTLTGLPNRTFFQATHQNMVRKDSQHALLCMDMDNFKKINDSLGHETGDRLIKVIANRLQKATDNRSTCYRLGGDEFSVLIEDTDIHHITHLAQKILDEMKRSFNINGQEFVLGGSVGIACYPQDGLSPQELLRNADTAMYHAKNEGGNQYQFFSHEMNQNAVRQLQIENLIRHGLKEDLFTLYYQPKVDIASGKMVSMEALVRFEHPQKGIVSPGQFIPLAEETGQIIEIGEQILYKACADTQKWVEQGLFKGRVAVNISARQFELSDLDQRIAKILQDTGLSAQYLECEITESALMQQPQQALALMQRMREMGVHLALDDFGTGYSSLAYLKQFPLNTLKIDKAFIDGIVSSHTDRQMTAAIISIAHNLGLEVVAEGVEDEDQLAILRRYKCETLQGYLFSKPLNKTKFSQLLMDSSKLGQLISNS